MQYGQPAGPAAPAQLWNSAGVVVIAQRYDTEVPPSQSFGPPKANTAQVPDWVQYEPASQSRSRAHDGGEQWPEATSHVSGATQVRPLAQPGTQAPPEQMLAGAPTHSESVLQPGPPSIGRGQLASAGSQQRPVAALHKNCAAQGDPCRQPSTHVPVVVRQTRSGGSQSASAAHGEPTPFEPKHSPLAESHVDPPPQRSGLARHPGTHRPSAPQTNEGTAQSLGRAQVSDPTTVVR
jgi:hypothetical protein